MRGLQLVVVGVVAIGLVASAITVRVPDIGDFGDNVSGGTEDKIPNAVISAITGVAASGVSDAEFSRRAQEVIQGFTVCRALSEFVGLGAQRRIVESLQVFLERIDLIDGSAVLAQQSLVAAAKNPGEKLGHGGSCKRNCSGPEITGAQSRVF